MPVQSQAPLEPAKTLDKLVNTNCGWSRSGAIRFVATMSTLIGLALSSSIMLAVLETYSPDGSSKWWVVGPLLGGLPIPIGLLVAAVYSEQHPLGEALKKNYVNPNFPPKEASFAFRYNLLWAVGFFAGILGVMSAIATGILYHYSSRSHRATAVWGLLSMAVCSTTLIIVVVLDQRIKASWANYVAVRDAES